MLTAIDSFVKALSSALTGVMTVAFVRQDERDPKSGRLRENQLNVRVLDTKRLGHEEKVLVSLDLIYTNERTAWAMAKAIVDVLFPRQMITEYDYTIPTAPVATGYVVSWSGDDLDFALVGADDKFVHLNSTFHISHVRVAGAD